MTQTTADQRHLCDYPMCSDRGSGHPLACNCRSADQPRTKMTVAERLKSELERRMWALFDAAKVISERGDIATPDDWAAFHIAVCNIPESQHP